MNVFNVNTLPIQKEKDKIKNEASDCDNEYFKQQQMFILFVYFQFSVGLGKN